MARSIALVDRIDTQAPSDIEPDPGLKVQIRKAYRGSDSLKAGQVCSIDLAIPESFGNSFILLSFQETPKDDAVAWRHALAVSDARLGYLERLPEFEADDQKRLSYFLQYLEVPDGQSSQDAFMEFSSAATHTALCDVSCEFSRTKLRQILRNPATLPDRVGLYGTMLGMCGQLTDAKLLDEMIFDHSPLSRIENQPVVNEVRIDDVVDELDHDGPAVPNQQEQEVVIDDRRGCLRGLILGYLLIRGEFALDRIDARILKNPNAGYSRTYSTLSAMQFAWENAGTRIPRERMRSSLRPLLDRPDFAPSAIQILHRWADWSIQDRLNRMYQQPGFNTPENKRLIVRYFVDCALQNEGTPAPSEAALASAAKGAQILEALRQVDPKSFDDAKRN